MNIGHPRDVDPSITGQPHQATGKVPDLMGNISRTLGNPVNMPAAVRNLVPPQLLWAPRGIPGTRRSLTRACAKPFRAARLRGGETPPHGTRPYAAPRWSASHTAVDSRAPRSIALPQCAIHAAMPSGVPDT